MVDLIAGEKGEKETKRAIVACNDYLRMGVGRSLRKLHEIYEKRKQEPDKEGTEKPPTTRFATIAGWSTTFGWVERAEVYDAQTEKEKTEEARQIMRTGLALEHERVAILKSFSQKIIDFFDKNDLWRTVRVKVGSGQYAELVDVEIYNESMLNDLRALLDDIAKETGGRKGNIDLTSGGKTIRVSVVDDAVDE